MDVLPIDTLKREERLSDRMAERLEELILRRTLEPGQKLPSERDLADMFGVSRTVVREATHNLTAKGLLEIRSGKGAYVTGPSTASVVESLTLLLRSMEDGFPIEDLHDIRRILETAIAARAAERASEEDIARLEDILRGMEAEGEAPDAVADLDVEFHRTLAVAAHNPLFEILLDSIGELLVAIRRVSFQEEETLNKARYHHHAILDAVKNRDAKLAEQAMSAHLDEAEGTMGNALRAHGHEQSWFRTPEDPPENAGGEIVRD